MKKTIVAVSAIFLSVEGIAMASMRAVAAPSSGNVEIAQIQKPVTPVQTPVRSAPSTVKRPSAPVSFGFADGTPIKLKFKHKVSSKTAEVNDPVEFEVAEAVRIGNTVVIAKGATARGFVKKVRRSGMLGRKGKLEIEVKDVDLLSGERITLRSSQENGGGNAGGVIALSAIVSPLFLLMKGKNVTYEAGTEVQGFVDGNFALDPAKFTAATPTYQTTPRRQSTRTYQTTPRNQTTPTYQSTPTYRR